MRDKVYVSQELVPKASNGKLRTNLNPKCPKGLELAQATFDQLYHHIHPPWTNLFIHREMFTFALS